MWFALALIGMAAAHDSSQAEGQVSTQYVFQVMDDSSAHAMNFRVSDDRGDWVGVEGRFFPPHGWVSRMTTGIDLFPKSFVDLRLGLTAGAVGKLNPMETHVYVSPQFGSDVSFGFDFDVLSLHFRVLSGFGGVSDATYMEREVNASWQFLPGIWAVMQLVDLEPNLQGRSLGGGLGVRARF